MSSVTELVPPAWRATFDSFMQERDSVLGEYLRGQLGVMLALAVFYAVGLRLFGLDLALPIGVFTGLAVFVPYLGFGLGLVLALLAGLLQGVEYHRQCSRTALRMGACFSTGTSSLAATRLKDPVHFFNQTGRAHTQAEGFYILI